MTTKERLHELVDELSEMEANDALRILIARRENGTGQDETETGDIADRELELTVPDVPAHIEERDGLAVIVTDGPITPIGVEETRAATWPE